MRYPALDGLRGVAAFQVVVVHLVAFFDFGMITGDPRFSHLAIDQLIPKLPFMLHIMADLPVCLFFSLSGFVLTASFSNNRISLLAGSAKRYVRLMPLILITSLLAFTLFIIFGEVHQEAAKITRSYGATLNLPNGVPSLAAVIFEGTVGAILGGFSYASTINGVLWTMPIEFQGSLLIIVVCFASQLITKNHTRRKVIEIGLHFAFLTIFARMYVSLFSAGALLYYATRSRLIVGQQLTGAAVLMLGLFIGTMPGAWVQNWPVPPVQNLPFSSYPHNVGSFYHGIGAVLILAGVLKSQYIMRLLSTDVPQFLGHVSFALYLVHLPIILTVGSATCIYCYSLGFPYWLCVVISVGVSGSVVYLSSILLTNKIDQRAISASYYIGRTMGPLESRVYASLKWRPASERVDREHVDS
ncbi:acyltransferase family protein [Bosea sp. 2RAB26]|uniref:acyltransferase family protein n=1 Tax=Bosea sp. 2RAB26 TaxID=3237476 RepID=UPI003F8E7B7C